MSAPSTRPELMRDSLLGRLAAWWQGAETPPPLETSAEVVEAPHAVRQAAVDLRSWSAERLEAAQYVYGAGWTSAGGETLYRELMKSLPLGVNDSVVLHGAALGGLASLIARESEAWVEAQEEDPLLAAEAARQVKAAGLAKKIVVLPKPLQSSGVKPGSRIAAISCEMFHRTLNKKAELATLCAMLKPGGQLLLTDFVSKGASAEAIGRWARCETAEPHFVTVEELKALLRAQGLDVRVCEDRSQDHCRAALGSLQALLRNMETSPVRKSLRGWLIWEVEVLTQKLQALDSGAIGFQRVFALAPGRKVER
jgi:hypothetical protein